MYAATLLFILGAFFIAIGVAGHFVSFLTPHYVHADLNLTKLQWPMHDYDVGFNTTELELGFNTTELEHVFEDLDHKLKVNYGLWKICYTNKTYPQGVCKNWNHTNITIGEWLRLVRVVEFLATLILIWSLTVAVINLCLIYRNQTTPYCASPACFIACLGGLIMFLGDVIVIASHKTFPLFLAGSHYVPDNVKKLLGDQFKLTWGLELEAISSAVMILGGVVHRLALCLWGKTVPYDQVIN